jgi:hypothetical protein
MLKSKVGMPAVQFSGARIDLEAEARKARRRLYPVTVVYSAYAWTVLALRSGAPVPATLAFYAAGGLAWTLLEYFAHRFVLHYRFPRRAGALPALAPPDVRQPAHRAPRPPLGRQPHQRHDQGHAPLRGPPRRPEPPDAALDRAGVLGGGRAGLRDRGMGPPGHALPAPLRPPGPLLALHHPPPRVPPQPARRGARLRPDERALGRRVRDPGPGRRPGAALRAGDPRRQAQGAAIMRRSASVAKTSG